MFFLVTVVPFSKNSIYLKMELDWYLDLKRGLYG